MNETEKTHGVVITKPQGEAILYYAIVEGLVDNNPSIGDGYVGNILRNPPLADVRDSAYEQLVIGEKIYLPFSVPKEWKGHIFDNGLVEAVPRIKDQEKIEIESLSDSTLLYLLRERGYNYSYNDLTRYRDEFIRIYKEWEEISNGVDYNVVLSLFHLLKIEAPNMYTEQQYQKAEELTQAYDKVRPVVKIFDEYSSIITHAISLNAYSSLHMKTTSASNVSLSPPRDICQQQALLQISCNKLNTSPIGYNLKQTIEIAKSPEAKAYRLKLDQWVSSLRNGEINNYQRMHDDVNYCLKQLRFSKSLSRMGDFLTYFSIPVSIAGLFNPIASCSGVALSIVGGIALTAKNSIIESNRWAMFGLKRSNE